MKLDKILKVVLLLLGGIYILLQSFELEVEGAAVSSAMLILLIVLYRKWTEKISKYFNLFLIFFTTAHVLSFLSWFTPEIYEDQIDYSYYITNLLYIVAYIFLIFRILKKLNGVEIFSKLSIPILVLLILDVFCVILVTDTTQGVLTLPEYVLELSYNAVIMCLLSVALINYMYRNDNKSMLFLIGSICIVFSEIIQLAYFYIMKDGNLGFIYSFFLVIAFVLFYLQSQQVFSGPEPDYVDDVLEEV